MAHISNGSVVFERRVRTGDFEHKHASITVHFALDPGESHDIVATAGRLAFGHVHQLLGFRPAPEVPVPDAGNGPVPGAVAPVCAGADVPLEPVSDGPADIPLEGLPPPVTNLKAAKRAAAKKDKGIDVVSDTVPEVVHIPPAVVEAVREIVEDFTAEAPAATDAELGQALSRKMAQLKDRPKIQTLLGQFVQAGQSYSLIPAVRRGEFMQKLEALA
jgi:hypothetical protein